MEGKVFPPGARVLVTGATSGIGREAALQLGAMGCRLALTGRREARLAEAAAGARAAGAPEVLELAGTVTDAEVVRSHYRRIAEAWGGLDVAILNAGISDSRGGEPLSTENVRRHLETNVLGACAWIEAVLPDMRARGRGVIAGVSSPAGWRGWPGLAPYGASKAALSNLLESLRVDLRGTGIDVVTVCPGFVKSEITARRDAADMPGLMDTEAGARAMLRGIAKRKRVVRFPWPFMMFLRFVIRPLPPALFDRVTGRLRARFRQRR